MRYTALQYIDNYDARLLTLDSARMQTITVVYNDAMGYQGWMAEYKRTNEFGRTVYEQGFGETPEEATVNLICRISGDETNRR